MSSSDLSHLFDQICLSSSAEVNCAVIRTLFPAFLTLPSTKYLAPSAFDITSDFSLEFLKEKLEFREITGNVFHNERLAIISSVIPSAKYSCSSSLLKFLNGRTAMAGGLPPSSTSSRFSSFFASLFSRLLSAKSNA